MPRIRRTLHDVLRCLVSIETNKSHVAAVPSGTFDEGRSVEAEVRIAGIKGPHAATVRRDRRWRLCCGTTTGGTTILEALAGRPGRISKIESVSRCGWSLSQTVQHGDRRA